jgi:hypothetical protein
VDSHLFSLLRKRGAFVRFEVLIPVLLNIQVVRYDVPCLSVTSYQKILHRVDPSTLESSAHIYLLSKDMNAGEI